MKREVEERLIELANDNEGKLTAEMVVEEAKNKASPLHDEFTWDNLKAAHQHRLDQARQLIRAVKVKVRTRTFEIKAPHFVRDPSVGPDEQGYVAISAIKTDEDRARDAVVAEFARAAAALQRARAVAKALDIDDGEIVRLREEIVGLSAKVENRPSA